MLLFPHARTGLEPPSEPKTHRSRSCRLEAFPRDTLRLPAGHPGTCLRDTLHSSVRSASQKRVPLVSLVLLFFLVSLPLFFLQGCPCRMGGTNTWAAGGAGNELAASAQAVPSVPQASVRGCTVRAGTDTTAFTRMTPPSPRHLTFRANNPMQCQQASAAPPRSGNLCHQRLTCRICRRRS